MGCLVGLCVGGWVGMYVGIFVGRFVGTFVGFPVGCVVGRFVGLPLGDCVGFLLGDFDGRDEWGESVGAPVGGVGDPDGDFVGVAVDNGVPPVHRHTWYLRRLQAPSR